MSAPLTLRVLIGVGFLWALGMPAQAKKTITMPYTAPGGEFSCEILPNWVAFAEPALRETAVHLLGPIQVPGAFRAAYHIHHFEKGRPGFVPIPDMLERLRAKNATTRRQATPLTTWRVAKKPARLFEATEERVLPPSRLPAVLTGLHYYYAVVQTVQEDYFIIRLATTEEAYLGYRDEFKRFLKSFRIVGSD